MKYKELKQKYDEILELLSVEELNIDSYTLERSMKRNLENTELLELYGIDKNKFTEHMTYYVWTSNHNISWNDGNKKPKTGDRLFVISFSTGAYIFGEYYPKELFNKFFNKLKSYKPDFSDTMNHDLYFKIENTKKIFNDYPKIWEKYKELNKQNFKKYKIAKLKKEINELD